MSSSVKGTIRLVTIVNLVLKLMHHISILFCVIFAPPAVCGVLSGFNVVTIVPGGGTAGNMLAAGSMLGEFELGAVAAATVVIGIAWVSVGEELAPAVIHWWYSVLRSMEMVVKRILPQPYTHPVRNRSQR